MEGGNNGIKCIGAYIYGDHQRVNTMRSNINNRNERDRKPI